MGTRSATQPGVGVAHHCGSTLAARGHGTCSRPDRRLRSANESSHRGEECHHAGRHHFLRARAPTHAVVVPFLVPSLGRALGHGALARAHVRTLHSCRCLSRVPSADGYVDWAPWSCWANGSATRASAMPEAAGWAVVTGTEVVRRCSSDAHVVHVRREGTQVDSHGTWETQLLAPPAVDGNTPKPVFAKELMGGPPESASENVRGGDMNCANFGVGHMALNVEQMTLAVAELAAGNPDVQVHTSMAQMSG